jgi:hypothetical protein
MVVLEPVVASAEGEGPFGPGLPDDLELFLEHFEPDAKLGHLEAERSVFLGIPACSDSYVHPTSRDVVRGDRELREDRRVPEGDRRDEGPKADARGQRGEPADRPPGVEDIPVAAGMLGQVVV